MHFNGQAIQVLHNVSALLAIIVSFVLVNLAQLRRIVAPLVLIGTIAAAATAYAEPTKLDCPSGSVNLQSETHIINEPCVLDGDIVLGGTATLVVLQTELVVDGDILLSDNARLIISSGTLSLDNHYVFEHRIESRGSAQIHFIGSILRTNISSPGNSLASQYIAQDQSVLIVRDSGVMLPDSWLLADLNGNAAVHAISSQFFPSEIYPHQNATVILQGAETNPRVWLEFLAGSQALIEQLPDETAPFDWSFGRDTPEVVNVGYQVEIINAIPTVGISSHPNSSVTLRDIEAPVAIGYFFTDLDSPQQISGLGPLSSDVVLEHQGRLFELDNANIFEFAWQIYTANPNVIEPHPVVISQSLINEIAAFDRGRIAVDASLLQWAVIAAVGPGSEIGISGSTINSQSIIASTDGFIHIDSSEIFGSLVEATDDAHILFSNVQFSPNVCHALCLPVCASLENGGFEGDRCNPFNPPGADSVFRAGDRATIAALGLRSIDAPLAVGETLDLRGDLFVLTGPELTDTYRYTLRYQQLGTSNVGTIVTDGEGPKQNQSLGTLDTSGLPQGDYAAILELHKDGQIMRMITREFRLVSQ